MGKLFAIVAVAAPLSFFAIWAYLHQIELTETRIDMSELRSQIERDQFDIRFAERWGDEPDPYLMERLERNRQRLAELEQERERQRAALTEAVATADAEMHAVEDRPESERSDPIVRSPGVDPTLSGADY